MSTFVGPAPAPDHPSFPAPGLLRVQCSLLPIVLLLAPTALVLVPAALLARTPASLIVTPAADAPFLLPLALRVRYGSLAVCKMGMDKSVSSHESPFMAELNPEIDRHRFRSQIDPNPAPGFGSQLDTYYGANPSPIEPQNPKNQARQADRNPRSSRRTSTSFNFQRFNFLALPPPSNHCSLDPTSFDHRRQFDHRHHQHHRRDDGTAPAVVAEAAEMAAAASGINIARRPRAAAGARCRRAARLRYVRAHTHHTLHESIHRSIQSHHHPPSHDSLAALAAPTNSSSTHSGPLRRTAGATLANRIHPTTNNLCSGRRQHHQRPQRRRIALEPIRRVRRGATALQSTGGRPALGGGGGGAGDGAVRVCFGLDW